jgi:hypothetical protein
VSSRTAKDERARSLHGVNNLIDALRSIGCSGAAHTEKEMGNNAAFTSFEATTLATYNKGVLDKELLSEFMEQYRDMDIDSGGMRGTLSKDGLDVIDVTLKVFGVPIPPRPDLPGDYQTWTPEQDRANEDWQEARWGAFQKITDQFGWC